MKQGRGRERHGTLWGPSAVKQQQELEAPCSLLQRAKEALLPELHPGTSRAAMTVRTDPQFVWLH